MNTRPTDMRSEAVAPRRMQFRHMLMLALAVNVMVLGMTGAASYRAPGIAVEQTVLPGHIVT